MSWLLSIDRMHGRVQCLSFSDFRAADVRRSNRPEMGNCTSEMFDNSRTVALNYDTQF